MPYKNSGGGGFLRNFAIELISNKTYDIDNRYRPGAGVGATSIATRRAKLIRATNCSGGFRCGRFFQRLTMKPLGTNTILDVISQEENVVPGPKPPILITVNPAVPILLNYSPTLDTSNPLIQFTVVSDQGELDGNYTTQSSSQFQRGSALRFTAAAAFGESVNPSNYWHSVDSNEYNSSTGIYNTSFSPPETTNINGSNVYGAWLQITLPYNLQLTSYSIGPRTNHNIRAPNTWYIVGRNLDTDPWIIIDSKSGQSFSNVIKDYNLPTNTRIFTTYRIVITAVSVGGNCVNMVMQLYGNKVIYQ